MHLSWARTYTVNKGQTEPGGGPETFREHGGALAVTGLAWRWALADSICISLSTSQRTSEPCALARRASATKGLPFTG